MRVIAHRHTGFWACVLIAVATATYGDTQYVVTTSDVGNQVHWDISNCSAVWNLGGNAYTDTWSMGYPIPAWGHSYAVIKELDKSRYAMHAAAYPSAGTAGGGNYTTNYLKVYAYENWSDYEVGWDIQWMPPGITPRVQATGEFLDGPDIFKIIFDGYDSNGRIIRRFLITVNVFNMPSSHTYEYWGSPGGGDGFGGDGGEGGDDWPPWPDDEDDPDPDSPDWEGGTGGSRGLGPGFCSINGLPVYHVNPANSNLVVRDSDFSYRSLGPDVEILRTYNAFQVPGVWNIGMFGLRWRLKYEWSFGEKGVAVGDGDDDLTVATPDEVYFVDGEGIRYEFDGQADTGGARYYTITAPAGKRASLYLNAAHDQWVMYRPDEELTYRFGAYTPTWAPYLARLESISDRNGKTLTINYFENENTHAHEFLRISSIVDAVGRTTSFTLQYATASGFPLCSSMTTPDGRSVTYEYDANDNLTRIVDMLGTEINHVYSGSSYDYPMTEIRVGSRVETFAYDTTVTGSPRIVSVTDAEGRTTTHFTDDEGVSSITSPNGDITTYTSNSDGHITQVVNSLGEVCSADFQSGHLTGIHRTGGGDTVRSYDTEGNLTQILDPNGFATNLGYDSESRLISRQDATGALWNYSRDTSGNLASIHTPWGIAVSYTRNASGQVEQKVVSGPSTFKGKRAVPDRTTTYEFDAWGNISAAVTPAGARTTFEYDAKGLHCTATVDPIGRRTEFEYDANDRLIRTTRPDGKTRTYNYLPCSWISTTNENGTTISVTRDMTFRILSLTDGSGGTTSYDYDDAGRKVSRTNPDGNTFYYVYDAMGRYLGTTSTLGTRLNQSYDEDWNVTGVTDARGNTTTYRYDDAGRRIAVGDPLGSSVTLTRDALGRVSQITNARGQTVGMHYDAAGHLIRRTHNGATVDELTYDAVGRLTEMRDSRGITGFSYNADDTVTGISYYDGTTVAVTPDAIGRAQTIVYPGGLTVSYLYDSLGRTSGIAWGSEYTSFTYTTAGDIETVIRSNGTSSAYSYNDARLVTGIAHRQGATDFATLTITRSDSGRVESIDASLPASPALSDQSSSATFDAANQVSDMAAASFSYDADGNLTASGAGAWTASYNPRNRPTQIRRNGVTTYYDYNALGYRTRVTVGETQVHNYHLSHIGTLLFETDAWDNLTACWIYASGRPVAMWSPSSGTLFYHYDHSLHTVALTDNSGTVVAAYRYTPYGMIAGQTGVVGNPFTWCGGLGVIDDGGGLYWMTHRLYDASSGRFLHRDPLGQRGGVNLYAYAAGDPANRADPSGLYGGYGGLGLSTCGPMTEEEAQNHIKYRDRAMLAAELGWNWVPGSGLVDAARHAYEEKYVTAAWDVGKFFMGPFGSAIGTAERLAQELPESDPVEAEARMTEWKKTQDRLSGKVTDPGEFPDPPGGGSDFGDEPTMVEGPPE